MFLKFKIQSRSCIRNRKWKVYECKDYSYRIFTFDKILDFLIHLQRQENGYPVDENIAVPQWLLELDLKILPEIDNKLIMDNRVISDKHTVLLATKCIHFEITPVTTVEKINVVTTKDVYVLSDKGQTVDRIIPNVSK